MPSMWFQEIAAVYVPLSIATALLVCADIYLLGRRQPMGIMEAVWPLTMLYWGPIGLIFYLWFGRGTPADRSADQDHDHSDRVGNDPGTGAARDEGHNHRHKDHVGNTPMWQATFKGATHCGAGCALGDFIGDWLVFTTGLTLLGSEMGGKYVLGFVLAYLFGIVFQYFSVVPMQGLGVRDGIMAAIRIDTLSLLAYQIGMFGCMAIGMTLAPGMRTDSWSYWLMMQVAMIVGFLTTYPVNWWLIRRGIKEKM